MNANRRIAAVLATAAGFAMGGSCLDPFNPAGIHFALSPPSATILLADTFRLTITPKIGVSQGGLATRWSTSNAAVATVDAAGLVRGMGFGSTVVRAALFDTLITATIRVTDMTLQPSAAQLLEGDTLQLVATVVNSRGDTVLRPTLLWHTSDTAVANVDSSGLVFGRRAGTVQVVARTLTSLATSEVDVATPVLVGAGDIADCRSQGDEATSALLDTIPGVVFTLGDNAYPAGSSWDFATCYAPSWGRYRYRTRPAPGNHDYLTPGASAYFAYFGARAGSPTIGYYSYDYGAWHVVVVNTSGDISAGSPQLQWLAADLATHPALCTIAYFHFPLFSSGAYAVNTVKPVWQVLYNAGVDVVASGHDHMYERFAPQNPDGAVDLVHGIRQFTVGTGGRMLESIVSLSANSEVQSSTTFGVLRLRLHPTGYQWTFIPTVEGSFTDSGSASCH